MKFAGDEMSRAQEDVVSYLVCHNLRKATENLLTGFLMLNGEQPAAAPMSRLLKKCCEYDRRFETIDLTAIECKGSKLNENDCLCTDFKKVGECMTVVQEIERKVSAMALAY